MATLHELTDAPGLDDGVQTLRDWEIRAAFAQRIRTEIAAGLEQYQSGDVATFPGYDPSKLSRTLVVTAEFDEDTRTDITDRVAGPLAQLAQAHGFEIGIPGESLLPSHVTVQQIAYDSEQEAQANLGKIGQQIQSAAGIMEGVVIPFDTLLLSGTRMVICMGNPVSTPETRQAFNAFDQTRWAIRDANVGEGVLQTDKSIIHTSVGRATALKSPDFMSFVGSANSTIGGLLRFAPIRARVGSVFFGSGAEQIRRVSPHLFAKSSVLTSGRPQGLS